MSSVASSLRAPVPLRPLGVLAGGLLALALAAGQADRAPDGVALSPPAAPSGAASGPPVVADAGRAGGRVRLEARAPGGTVAFTAGAVVLATPRGSLRQRWAGARPDAAPAAVDPLPGRVNVLRGRDPSQWRAGLPTFAGVRAERLWPGVDVRHDTVLAAGRPWVRSTYEVAPGGDPGRIGWRYEGAVRLDRGALLVAGRRGAPGLRLAPAAAWQRIAGRRVPVDARYTVAGDGTVRFSVGRFDRGQPLLLAAAPVAIGAATTPPALRFSSFLGGTRWDEAFDVDAGPGGDLYLTGITMSQDFPATRALTPELADVMDVVVTRVDAAGDVVYSTYLGGEKTDAGLNVAVDAAGNAYVTGRTESEDFPIRSPLQTPINGRRCQEEPCHDAFIAKLDPQGALVSSTYLGGTGNEDGLGLAVDSAGRVHVSGNTDSDDFPTRNAAQDVNRSRGCAGDLPCPYDSFVARLNAAGTALEWSTYLGGRAGELNGGLAIDRSGGVFVIGTTRSPDFPTRDALQPAIAGTECGPPPGFPCTDVYLTKLDGGGRIAFSTYLGGTGPESSGGIAVDRHGRPHLVGMTQSRDFPTARPIQPAIDNRSCNAEPDAPKELCDDAFLTGFGADGRRLVYSTYFGGDAEDQALAVAVDAKDRIHVAGSTDSHAFPVRDALQPRKGRAIDAFVARLAPEGRSLLFSTYLGGTESERINGIAADRQGGSVVAGRTTSPDFPTVDPFQAALAGDIDAFAARIR